ncbi:bifunctional 2-keto-4-hydroxyglutarate aldolase/2-keto-3-deoxy-6-phosphogluconate aldolase [uncultured Dialister sp.]|jgi:2-dehydro-3-deoxyphosphogluconate aldolase/(4S)-4-hydroxy-2-oxoglutarate aldolase|uniref:bifunctional 2-keto-4-hydroxyglutarate aldolase/2-keto-3-deoxy-6-phosphogluconate aldolase n=1 Tax=uncultured Dialister sp. TaxID=278064 RepID=UPI0026DC03F5|nr:bifunctional 2-keto-4-hydroxyglutarate aldolase/2-keto-3-deoxy-6-phosphogluconate aldolase [uncultured Dialister sp.]
MNKSQVLVNLQKQGIIAVVRGSDMESGVKIADACIAGGVKAIELAFTTPRAQEAIHILVDKYKENKDVIIGAGTVLDAATARIAILSGAQFIVSPSFDEETIKVCNLYRIVSCPGIMTPKEGVDALKTGADILKVFPGDIVGYKMIKDLHGPLPQAALMPSGGVDVDNVSAWLKAGCVAVSAGGSLTAPAKIGNFSGITDMAKKFVCAVQAARL